MTERSTPDSLGDNLWVQKAASQLYGKNVPLLHMSTQHPGTSLHMICFSKPSLALVLQATNARERRLQGYTTHTCSSRGLIISQLFVGLVIVVQTVPCQTKLRLLWAHHSVLCFISLVWIFHALTFAVLLHPWISLKSPHCKLTMTMVLEEQQGSADFLSLWCECFQMTNIPWSMTQHYFKQVVLERTQ